MAYIFPFTTTGELNQDWILKQVQDFTSQENYDKIVHDVKEQSGITGAITAANEAADHANDATETANVAADRANSAAATADNVSALIAEPFLITKDYSAGWYVTYSGGLYRFNVFHTAGEWDASQVSAVTTGNQLTALNTDLDYVAEKLPQSLITTAWTIGAVNAATGANAEATNRVRSNYVSSTKIYRKIIPDTGYKFTIRCYDAQAFLPDPAPQWFTEEKRIDEIMVPGTIYVRIVAAYANDSNISDASEVSAHIIIRDVQSVPDALAAGRSNVSPLTLAQYTPTGETFSVWTDMPDNTYVSAYPAAFSGSVSADVSWRAGTTYKIKKINRVVYIEAPSLGFAAMGIYNVSNNIQSWFTSDMLMNNDDEVQVYTDFTTSPLRWSGVILGESSILCHTNNFRVYPGRTYYLAQIGYTSSGTLGCFLTMGKQPFIPLTTSDLTEEQYAYTTDNPNADYTRYTKLYKFTVPENCHYLSLNWSTDTSNNWRFFLASKPLFRLGNTGNLIIKKDSPLLQKANKRLCVVGPSYAMIDRRTQASMNGQTTIGFQEYLWPYYHDITTFGYSGGAWGQIRDDEYISVYSGIVTGYGSVLPKDFTPYDEVLLIGCNPNGFFSTPRQVEGEAGTWDANTSPVSTFMGGMRGVVEYILTQKPTMKIYVANFWHTSGSVDATYRATCDTLNEEMLKLANIFGLQYIDMYNGTPFNKYNYTLENKLYSYDGVHPNQQGLMQIADVLVRAMVLGK